MDEAITSNKRGKPKGRAVDATALAEVQALLGAAPRRRDLLIEHLHRIQDRYGRISAAHIVALAREMALATAEVYEVATFYHHFDVDQGRRRDAARAHGARLRFTVVRTRRRAAAARRRCGQRSDRTCA